MSWHHWYSLIIRYSIYTVDILFQCSDSADTTAAMDRLFFWDSIHAFKCLTVSFPAKLCTDFLARERGAPVYSVWASSWRTWMANYLRSQGLSYASILDFGSSVINLKTFFFMVPKNMPSNHSYSNSSSYSSHSSWIFLWFPGKSYDFLDIPMISYTMSTSKIPDVSSMTRRNNEQRTGYRPEIPASLAWISRGCHGSFVSHRGWIFWKWRNGDLPESYR